MNFQNIPRKDKVVKQAFLPKLDALLMFDYKQIELRLLALYLASVGDESMADVIRAGGDLHTETARGVFGIPEDREPTEEERTAAKIVNFSIVYGGGVKTLCEQLSKAKPEGLGREVKPPEAMKLLRGFHGRWPYIGWGSKWKPADEGTLLWWLDKKVKARVTPTQPGYLIGLWGRHLHLGPLDGEHTLLNKLVQNAAADLMKAAAIRVHNWTKAEGLQSHLINLVHDEMILDAATPELSKLVGEVPRLMIEPKVEDVVPLGTDVEISTTNWAEKRPYMLNREESFT